MSKLPIDMMELDDEEDIKDLPQYCIAKANECESRNEYYFAKSWLLTGKSASPDNFNIQYESYLLEKRRKSIPETAKHFEQLYRKFSTKMENEITEIANAVRSLHMTRGKETEDQVFLNKIFTAFPKTLQMEVLMSQIEKTTVEYEKCQIMLLLVKLFPDTVHQHGADLLFTLLAYESDVFSIFRKLLVTELIPAVLQIKQDWTASPQIFQILHQCIEYYVLVSDDDDNTGGKDRWSKLFDLIDQIGELLHWKISPFFSELYSGHNSIDALFQSLPVAFQHRHHYSSKELAYVTVVFFLQCIVTYHRLSSGKSSKLSGDNNSKLILVEVFTPSPHRNSAPDPSLPVLVTASHCSTVRVNQTHLIQYFLTATKIWQLINSLKGDRLEKEFFVTLQSMKALDVENWEVFQDFSIDYRTYVGQHFTPDSQAVKHPLKLASFNCALSNFKVAADNAIKAVNESYQSSDRFGNKNSTNGDKGDSVIVLSGGGGGGSSSGSHREDVNFFNSHVYSVDAKGNFVEQRRVHFLSENPAEVIAYAANVLIKCFHETLEISHNDLCIGHLLTLLQLEWPSPPAENVFIQIMDIIKRKGSFRYCPYFGDFVIEPDFLENFMALANQQDLKNLTLDIWPNNNGTPTGSLKSRRIATRGVDKGAKTDFRNAMKRHILKSGQENLENLIVKFLTNNKFDIICCLDQPYKKSSSK